MYALKLDWNTLIEQSAAWTTFFICYYWADSIADASRGWSKPQKKSHLHTDVQQTITINDQ